MDPSPSRSTRESGGSQAPWEGGSGQSGRRPVVLCVVDRPQWAHDRKTDALARELAGTFEIVKRFQPDFTDDDLERADCIVFYYWMQLPRLGAFGGALERSGKPVAVGICSHSELEGASRQPGLDAIERFAKVVFVNNGLLRDEFAPLLSKPVHYTPNGVDTDFFRPASGVKSDLSPRTLRIGWAGSLTNHGSEHRGVQEFIVPAARLAGAEVVLAMREERWRDRNEMLEFYHSIDVYVCASRSEGTPNPCLEAAACGLPVVTTAVGNMLELIRHGENGFFVARDVRAIAETLAGLRDDPSLRERTGRAARASVQGWDWRRRALPYGAMLRALCEAEAPLISSVG